VIPEDFHDFFLTTGGAAAALIGLLFVAITVSAERLAREETGTQLHRIRAVGALIAFTNALTISLFALIPEDLLGGTAVSVSLTGLSFVGGAIVSLIRLHEVHWGAVRDAVFLGGLVVVFVVQFISGFPLIFESSNPGDVDTIAILVIVCFIIGIQRAWELIGGPSIGLSREVTALVRTRGHNAATDTDTGADTGGGPPPARPE
jgi:hypothetical protein